MIEVRRIKSISAHASAGMTDRKGSSPKMRFRAETLLAIGRISPLLSPFSAECYPNCSLSGKSRVAVYAALFCLITVEAEIARSLPFYLNLYNIFGG